MTYGEFASTIGYIELGCRQKISRESLDVYFELLGDLPSEAFQIAAKRVVLEHPWATFPSIAELRLAAAEALQGHVSELSPSEAWHLAWKAAGKIDLDIPGSADFHCRNLPPIVSEAMAAFGVPSLVNGKDPVGVIRGQFIKIFEQLQARDRRLALLPNALKGQIKAIGQMPRETLALEKK